MFIKKLISRSSRTNDVEEDIGGLTPWIKQRQGNIGIVRLRNNFSKS